jgi:hypothetical protein
LIRRISHPGHHSWLSGSASFRCWAREWDQPWVCVAGGSSVTKFFTAALLWPLNSSMAPSCPSQRDTCPCSLCCAGLFPFPEVYEASLCHQQVWACLQVGSGSESGDPWFLREPLSPRPPLAQATVLCTHFLPSTVVPAWNPRQSASLSEWTAPTHHLHQSPLITVHFIKVQISELGHSNDLQIVSASVGSTAQRKTDKETHRLTQPCSSRAEVSIRNGLNPKEGSRTQRSGAATATSAPVFKPDLLGAWKLFSPTLASSSAQRLDRTCLRGVRVSEQACSLIAQD